MGKEAESFAELLTRRAPKNDFMEWFRSSSQPKTLSAPQWIELVVPVARAAGDLAWMPEEDASLVQMCILHFVQEAFTVRWLPGKLSFTLTNPEAFKEFTTWLESLPDRTVVSFCWELLAHDQTFTPAPVHWLYRSGRLSGAMSYANIRLAVSLSRESEAIFWWPKDRWAVVDWARDSQPYFAFLSHSSFLVRAATARALGRLFIGVNTKGTATGVPRAAEMLSLIQDYEVKTPGIAGPFLEGASWGIETDAWSTLSAGVDVKEWFLATLRQSGREPEVPTMQSLELYAHELFAFDRVAILEMLKMGRRKLAVLTATEEPDAIPELLPVLNEMAASDDTAVSSAIREYLVTKEHHAGCQHLER